MCGEEECLHWGPYLTGISEEACNVHGGTFCPITNCTVLKDCVKTYHVDAVNDDRSAFATYLEGMPGGDYLTPANCANATDPAKYCAEDWLDPDLCGNAREYFGFDATFVNDQQICSDINQFQNTRDFLFLEEFFKQGSDSEVEIEFGVPPLVPPLILTLPAAGKLFVREDTEIIHHW
jgi:hypothetical protein